MTLRALLLVTSLLTAAPALAAIDPPAASNDDARIRTLMYDPNNPVEIHTTPGASLRLEFGADEEIVQVITSDQDILAPDPTAPPLPAVQASTGLPSGQGGQANQLPPSCDVNLCRSVWGNIVYIKPIRPLNPQPLFVQTRRTGINGKPEMVPYAFELSAAAPDPHDKNPPTPVWGVRFSYPERVKAQQVAAWLTRKHKDEAAAKERASLAQPASVVPGPNANFRYGYRGADLLRPDEAWDDGRTTVLRFNGNRRVPNIYAQLPDGKETLLASSTEPDATGNTLKIAGTGRKWFLRDGDEAGCLFDLGPDPNGRTASTIAAPQRGGR